MKEIEIKGSYSETGFILGKLHKNVLKRIEKEVVKNIELENEKIKKFEKCLEKFSFLKEEIEGYCKGADIKFENLLKLKLGNYQIPKISCTSLYLDSKFYEENCKVFMKIRDEKPIPQYMCKKQNFKKIPIFYSGSISDIGIAFFVKENGFVGINNTGNFLKQEYVNEYGFDDCDIMRIIAEEADEVEEGIEVIKRLQKDRFVGYVSKKRGMIFLFGKGEKVYLVEINSFDLNYKEINGNFTFTNDFLIDDSKKWIENIETEGTKSSKMRKERVDEILQEKGKFKLEDLIEISRDKKYYPYSICRDTSLMPIRTISSFIFLSNKEPVIWISLGNTYVSPFFPFFLKGNKIYENFVSGDISLKLNFLFEKTKLNDILFLEKIRNFEKSLKEKLFKLSDIEIKNLEIQKQVYEFIEKEIKNESLYNS